ncbi:MAG TPA: acetyl-CoA carboxylase biotin carboxyl carrier protein [Gammaproteobacteria bacterium]|nr:acetyl-CoA carboxylase biotin carboxyl carrier protein [Gammaproteobacteria bacterium]
MDFKHIKKLIQMVESSSIEEIEIKEGETSIRVKQGSEPISTPPQKKTTVHVESPKPTPHETQGHIIKSPMVGTAYLAPEPGSEPFIHQSKAIKAGETLCLIEAMKMFNKIKSDKSGILKRIFIENGQPIEFDQPLFEIEDA